MAFEKEADFEAALIRQLTEKHGWEPEILRYPTEEDLLRNWAAILFENNRSIDRLNDVPLTEGEMNQLLEQIQKLRTPVALNDFVNGKEVTIVRDNPDDGLHYGREVSLHLYDRMEIAAGRSRYQIAEQPVFRPKGDFYPKRRGDFTLLINGMPLIHVELKRSGVDISRACNQIRLYAHEGVFTGLFSLVQIFVAMTPEKALYFANPGPEGTFNPAFYFHWADFNNEYIEDWQCVAEHLLSIPMAHQLIGFYTVADRQDGILKVMRSYQYYAASKIADAVHERDWSEKRFRGGYIWHTTGSGKTMTSFKSAQLIAASRDADKVVFLMDRIELGTQSLREYRGFSRDDRAVAETEDTDALAAKLKSDDPADTLIVTSIQKMSRIRAGDVYRDADIERMRRKRIVFIIDEAHRDTFGEMLRTIRDTFPYAMFFGFTGTPIHEENRKKGNTTTDVFGDELHRYSIADGIRDKNVLGFDPYQVLVYRDKDLRRVVALEKARAATEEEALADPKKAEIYRHYMGNDVPMAGYTKEDGTCVRGIEDDIPRQQYETEEYERSVVQDVLENWEMLSHSGKFHAIFATSSIPQAVRYYRLFRKMAPQLKVTALFDPSTDGRADAVEKEESIREIVEDYNERYGMHFQMATYGSFKKDAAARLAHREPYRNADRAVEERLDLLIVVDQMLTGFDSKWVNTLYLDKVLRYEMLIQAFSRTNRIFGPEKPFGIIRYYRKPHTMKRNVEDAFRLYSGDRPYGLFVEKLRTNLKRMAEAAARIREIFTDGGVPDLSHIPDDKTERGAFARAFRELNEYLEAAKVQGFSWEKERYDFREEDGQPAETVPAPMDEQTYLTLAQRYKELFRKDDEDGDEGSGADEDTAYEIDPYLTEINTDRIDTAYMTSRFRKYLKALQDASETAGVLAELHRSFASLSREEQRYAESFLNDIRDNTIHVSGEKSFRWYLAKYMERAQNDEIHRFAGLIGVEEDRLRRLIARHPNAKTINAYDDLEKLKANMDMDRAKNFLESLAGKSLSTFQIRMQADKQLRSFILNGHITRPAVKAAKADKADKADKAAETPAPYGK